MTIHENTEPMVVQEARAKIDQIDLAKIHLNLMEEGEGPGWSAEHCQVVELRYRMFLMGRLLFPELTFAPDKDVDTFWHYHILDTRAYIADCNLLFGEYLHHNPYLGMEGDESLRELERAWKSTRQLYVLTGIDPPKPAAFCGMLVPAFCGREKAAFCGMASPAFCGT